MKILEPPFSKRDGAKNNPAKRRPLRIIEIRYTDGSVEKPGKGITKPKPVNKGDKYIKGKKVPKL